MKTEVSSIGLAQWHVINTFACLRLVQILLNPAVYLQQIVLTMQTRIMVRVSAVSFKPFSCMGKSYYLTLLFTFSRK